MACLTLACGARSELATPGGSAENADAGSDADDATAPPPTPVRLFTTLGLTTNSAPSYYFDLPDASPHPLLPPSGYENMAMVRVGDRLYVADGDSLVWFRDLATTLDGPHTFWSQHATALAYAAATDALYALDGVQFPARVVRFDSPNAGATGTPAASFDVTVDSAPFVADDSDRLFFHPRTSSQQIAIVEHASTLAGPSSPNVVFVDTPFTSSFPMPMALGPTRLWVGGADNQSRRLLLGYDLATFGEGATATVSIQDELPAGTYVGALDAQADVLAVAVDQDGSSAPPAPPTHVAIFTSAGTMTSDASPERVLQYPSVADGWCGYAITVIRYVQSTSTLFAGGWGYLAVDQLGATPSRFVIDPCDPKDSSHVNAPLVYLALEPVYP
jgi:hypothetical protein